MPAAVPTHVLGRARAAVKLLLAGDALAMPVHWFYNPEDIQKAFPPSGVTKLEPAPAKHPHPFMRLPENEFTTEAGQPLIGGVILRGKRSSWGDAEGHVHPGLAAGENTLNAHMARLVVRVAASTGGQYDAERFQALFIDLLTAEPPQHPDSYAESYLRTFFERRASGLPPAEWTAPCEYIGAIVSAPIVAIFALLSNPRDVASAQAVVKQHLSTFTVAKPPLLEAVDELVALIDALLFRGPADSSATIIGNFAEPRLAPKVPAWRELLEKPGIDVDAAVVCGAFGPSCEIVDAWPTVLYLAAKYAADPASGLLVNTNRGGDNVHRGAVLGAILGLAADNAEKLPFVEGLAGAAGLEADLKAAGL